MIEVLVYEGKVFVSTSNTETGDVSAETRFYYRQKGDLVWATYEGGAVRFGTLVAKAEEEGRLRLHESWRWTSGNDSEGSSIVEELAQ